VRATTFATRSCHIRVSSAWTPYTVQPLQINAEKYQGAVENAIVRCLLVSS